MLDKKKTSIRATTSDMKYRLRTQNDWRSPLLKRSPTAERISSRPQFYQYYNGDIPSTTSWGTTMVQ